MGRRGGQTVAPARTFPRPRHYFPGTKTVNSGKIVNGRCNYEWVNDELAEPLQWEMLVVERAATRPASRP